MVRTTVEDVKGLLESNLATSESADTVIENWIEISNSIVDQIQAKGQSENLEQIERLWTAHLVTSNPRNEGHRRKSSVAHESGETEFEEGMNPGDMAMMLDTTGTLSEEDKSSPNFRSLNSRGL